MSKIPINNLRKIDSKYLLKDFNGRKINSNPYIAKLKNLLSNDEIDDLMQLVKGKFEKSNLVVNGELVYNTSRTSSTAYLFDDGMPDKYSKNIEKMIRRICYLLNCERSQLEIMCVRYKKGEKFDAHIDYFEDDEIDVLDKGGQRIATFFVYLNSLHEGDGGTTEFTKLKIKSKPRKGDSLFWWNQDQKTGKMIPMTEHRGNPVKKEGVIKYGMNIWIRSKSFY